MMGAVTQGSGVSVVILDRIEPGVLPAYCTHGRATCIGGCGEWLWLGHATHDLVNRREALPLCRQCAEQIIAPGAVPQRHVEDHLRADGPHE
jgi:hypothetical protein